MSDETKTFNPAVSLALGCLGALLGGVVGWFGFFWVAKQGFYALVLPGGALGIGAGALVRHRSVPFSIVCGVAALALGIFTEWKFAPFIKDASLGYFLAHLHQLKPVTLIFIALGGFVGFWMPFRAKQR